MPTSAAPAPLSQKEIPMAKNLTPAHLRCPFADCPSVHELQDGRLLIVGKRVDFPAMSIMAIAKSPDEEAIVIDRELLANLSPWQLISTAPKDGTPVDLWIVPSGISGTGPGRCPDCWHSNGKWWRYDEAFGDGECKSEVANATHWQPLPLPPALSQIEEAGTADEVSAANTAASLT